MRPPHLTRFSLCSLSLSLRVSRSLSLFSPRSLSLSRLAVPPSRYRLSARRRIDTRCLPAIPPYTHTCQWGHRGGRGREECRGMRGKRCAGGQIAIALYHSRRRTASARGVVEKCHFSSTAKGREWESLPAPTRQTRSAHRRLPNTTHHVYTGRRKTVAFTAVLNKTVLGRQFRIQSEWLEPIMIGHLSLCPDPKYGVTQPNQSHCPNPCLFHAARPSHSQLLGTDLASSR